MLTPPDYEFPAWEESEGKSPHDWKKYVSYDVRCVWSELTTMQKMVLAECFEEIASREEWD